MTSSRQGVYLVGHHKHQITGSKLPSNGDCLQVLFYNMRIVGLNLDCSANLVIDECNIFWKKARIPTQELHKCKLKLKKLYEVWQNLAKSKNKTSEVLTNKRSEFISSMNDLFDISHQNSLAMMTIEEDKQFLIKQREKGRTGCMIGIDKSRVNLEKRRLQRLEKEEERKRKLSDSTLVVPSQSNFLT